MRASLCAFQVPALLMTALFQMRNAPVPVQLAVPPPAMFRVRVFRSLVPPLAARVPLTVVAPAPLIVPAVQLNGPTVVRVPVPAMAPASRFSVTAAGMEIGALTLTVAPDTTTDPGPLKVWPAFRLNVPALNSTV